MREPSDSVTMLAPDLDLISCDAADHGGPVQFARIGILQALRRHVEPIPSLKTPALGQAEAEAGRMKEAAN